MMFQPRLRRHQPIIKYDMIQPSYCRDEITPSSPAPFRIIGAGRRFSAVILMAIFIDFLLSRQPICQLRRHAPDALIFCAHPPLSSLIAVFIMPLRRLRCFDTLERFLPVCRFLCHATLFSAVAFISCLLRLHFFCRQAPPLTRGAAQKSFHADISAITYIGAADYAFRRLLSLRRPSHASLSSFRAAAAVSVFALRRDAPASVFSSFAAPIDDDYVFRCQPLLFSFSDCSSRVSAPYFHEPRLLYIAE